MKSLLKAMKQKYPSGKHPKILAPKTHTSTSGLPSGLPTTILRPEYRMLDIIVEINELSSGYHITNKNCPMDDIFEESPIILLAKPCFLKDIGSNQHQETIQENHFHKLNRDIEENIFSLLCKLHEIALASSQLEQYVLRELRHLQECLVHKYPPLAAYLMAPIEDLIQGVRSRSHGLYKHDGLTILHSPLSRPQCTAEKSSPSPEKKPKPQPESHNRTTSRYSDTTTDSNDDSSSSEQEATDFYGHFVEVPSITDISKCV